MLYRDGPSLQLNKRKNWWKISTIFYFMFSFLPYNCTHLSYTLHYTTPDLHMIFLERLGSMCGWTMCRFECIFFLSWKTKKLKWKTTHNTNNNNNNEKNIFIQWMGLSGDGEWENNKERKKTTFSFYILYTLSYMFVKSIYSICK